MKSFFTKISVVIAFIGLITMNASAQTVDSYYVANSYPAYYQPAYTPPTNYQNNNDVAYLLQLIAQLQAQLDALQGNNYYNNQYYNNGYGQYGFTPVYGNGNYYNNNSRPDVDTESARDIQDDSAELRGEVDMNDYNNGIVFFVYGQDEDAIEDVESDYDEYNDVDDDEEDDDFMVVRVDRDLDGSDSYNEDVDDLEEDEEYFFIICVEYEEDNDSRLECGDVEDFDTDDDSDNNNEEPDVETRSAVDIQDDSAELRGFVDMNDFDNGRAFFVWGEDESDVEDVEDEDTFSDIDEQGDELQKDTVDVDVDNSQSFELEVYGLDDNTEHFFRFCVQYEDSDNDYTLECGNVRDFETD